MIDIRKNQEILNILNAILNNNGIAEIKQEGKGNICVVEIKRQLRTSKKDNDRK